MNRLFLITVITVIAFFAYQQITFAACGGASPNFFCDTNPPNPDPNGIQQSANNNNLIVNVFPGAGIDIAGNCIATGDGADDIDVDGGELVCNAGVRSSGGNDTIHVTDSNFDVRDDGVVTGSGDNTVNVINSMITTLQDDGIEATGGVNVINVTDSMIVAGGTGDGLQLTGTNETVSITSSNVICAAASGSCNAIDTSNGVHNIAIVESTLRGPSFAITLGGGDDTLTLGTGSNIEGAIDCEGDFDTLIFAMDVPEGAVAFISSQIASKDPAGDSIVINDLFYEWENCELLVSQLKGVRNVRPIPTLSEWGLIAMAGVLGIAGFMVIRRRKATA